VAKRFTNKTVKIAIGIASAGRPKPLSLLLEYLGSLNVEIPEIFICTPNKDQEVTRPPELRVTWLTTARGGLCLQRNILLQAAKGMDFLVYFDDDFLPRGDYFINLTSRLAINGSSIAALTGLVIGDGVTCGGISFLDGLKQLECSSSFTFQPNLTPVFNCYGCNMVVNLKTIREHSLRFDENLPMYGWLEDVEFSLQLRAFGALVLAGNCVGVHLGSPEGRQGARCLGYSQVANPYYICRKHHLSSANFLHYFLFRLLKNTAGALGDNPVRRARLAGNLLALRHLVQGTLDPRYISQMA